MQLWPVHFSKMHRISLLTNHQIFLALSRLLGEAIRQRTFSRTARVRRLEDSGCNTNEAKRNIWPVCLSCLVDVGQHLQGLWISHDFTPHLYIYTSNSVPKYVVAGFATRGSTTWYCSIMISKIPELMKHVFWNQFLECKLEMTPGLPAFLTFEDCRPCRLNQIFEN